MCFIVMDIIVELTKYNCVICFFSFKCNCIAYIIVFKDDFYSFLFSIDFFHIYIAGNLMLNSTEVKKPTTVGHCARFFLQKMVLNTRTYLPLPTILTLFDNFDVLTYQVLKL